MQSVLASSIWQYWQRGFCASFPLPLSVQRVLPSDAPFLQAGDGSVAEFDRNRQLSNLRMLESRKVGKVHLYHHYDSISGSGISIYQYLVPNTKLTPRSLLLCILCHVEYFELALILYLLSYITPISCYPLQKDGQLECFGQLLHSGKKPFDLLSTMFNLIRSHLFSVFTFNGTFL